MDSYLQQFKNLPRELREAVSSEEKIKALEEIERKFNLKLVRVVVRVMIKDITWSELEKFLQENFHLSPEKAVELKRDLAERTFSEVMGYLEKVESSKQKVEEVQKPATAETQEASESQKNSEIQPAVAIEPEKIKKEESKQEFEFEKLVKETKAALAAVAPIISSSTSNLEEIIREIKQKLNLVFEDEILEKRFESIVGSYLKEIRNEMQLEEVFCRSSKIGGLNFTPEKAALVVRIAKKFKGKLTEKVESRKWKVEEMQKNTGTIQLQKPAITEAQKYVEIDRNMSRPAVGTKLAETSRNAKETQLKYERNTVEIEKPVNQELKQRFESGTILPAFSKIEPPFVPQRGTTEGKKPIEAKKFVETNRNMPRPLVGTKQVERKGEILIQIKKPISEEKLVGDINQVPPRAIGLVEELAEITSTDLQRWGGAQNTAQIIFDKINLLNEISLAKRAEGIHSWQKSPLYKLYLEIGQEALEKKKSILQIIQEREIEGRPSLRIEDFEAINELNQKLRF